MGKQVGILGAGVVALGLTTTLLADALLFDRAPASPAIASSSGVPARAAVTRLTGDPRPYNAIGVYGAFGGGGLDGTGALSGLAESANTLSGTPTVSAVPEPSTWSLMLAGVAALGAALRTRRRSRVKAPRPRPSTVVHPERRQNTPV